MNELNFHQKRIINKLLSDEFIKEKDLETKLSKLAKFYRQILERESDITLDKEFNKYVDNILSQFFYSLEIFEPLNEYKNHYNIYLDEFLDYPDSNEIDFIESEIKILNKIINKSFKYIIDIDGYESLELTQFVKDEFWDEFIPSAKRKVEFLKTKRGDEIINTESPIEYENPYPDYFNSYGYEIYEKFTSQFEQDDILLAPISFLVYQLKKDGLMNKDKSLKNIFNFMIEELDVNFGTAVKLKSDFSTDKYIHNYKLILDSYIKNQEL